MSAGRAPSRARRGAVVGLLAGAVALGAHLSGGGPLPHPAGLALAAALCALVGALAAGVRRDLPRAVVLVGAAQGLLHGLFLLFAPAGGPASATVGGAHHAASVPDVTSTALATASEHAHAGMWGAHALAALITIVLLFQGERLARALLGVAGTLARRVVRRLAEPFRGPAPLRPHARHTTALLTTSLPESLAAAVRPLRGPPAHVGV